jgi:hypothetical protein
MGVDLTTRTDLVLTWVGAVGVIAYTVYIHGQRSRSPLEARTLFLLYALGTLFLVRGLYWLYDGPWLETLRFVPTTLLPLATTLFVEGLRRRHASPALKTFIAAGTLLFFGWNLLGLVFGQRGPFFHAFSVFALLTMAWLGWDLLARRRPDLSPMENRFTDALTAVLAFCLLLFATDFGLRPAWVPFRLGSLGGLLFVYACVRLGGAGDAGMRVLREVLGIGVRGLLVAAALLWLTGEPRLEYGIGLSAVSTAFVLLFTILGRLRALRIERRDTSFSRWFLHADTSSLERFVESLRSLAVAEQHLVLHGRDLDGYEDAPIVAQFDTDHPVWTVSALRSKVASPGGDPAGAEQLVDLLESHQMSHAALLSERPVMLLLLHLPEVAGTSNPLLEIALIQKCARLLHPGSTAHA